MVELVRRYSNRPDLLYDLETLMSSLRRATAGGAPEQRLSVSSTGRLGRQWALSERLTEDQEQKVVDAFLAGASKPQLAREYGISPKSVQRVLRKHEARRVDRRDALSLRHGGG
jgi:FixJ family two-component response regulator